MKTLLRFFFHLLYHPFAFVYDLVAATVSLNRWKDWILSVIPFLQGTRLLEIGHGPGHLQKVLLSRRLVAVGIDESAQMGRLAQRNLRKTLTPLSTPTPEVPSASLPSAQSAYAQISLARGVAQQLPFAKESFDSVVATFPAEYIFDPNTLAEAGRVLVPGGRFVILPGASITSRRMVDRVLAWIFRITGEAPANLSEIIHESSKASLVKAGFQVEAHEITVKSSLVFILVATKSQIAEEVMHAEKTT